MRNRFFAAAAVAVSIVFVGLDGIAAQTAAKKAPAKAYTPARTPWGDPDLAGVYTNKDENGIPVERPSQFEGKKLEDVDDSEFAEIVRARNEASVTRAPGIGGAETGAGPVHWYEHYDVKNSRPWLVTDPADGRIPATTPEAGQRAAVRAAARAGRGPADSYEDRSLYDQCITRGLPGSMMPAIYGNSYQIHQGPGVVAIRYEMIHETRIIPLDQRGHVGSKIKTYMGDARGHWDGGTLVVETTNFRPGATYQNANADTLRIIERFTRVDAGTIDYKFTIDDPMTWTKPWSAIVPMSQVEGPLFEYACTEGNNGAVNILEGARAADKAAAEAAKKELK